MYGLYNTKDITDKCQADYEYKGEEVDTQLGTNNIAAPVNDGISDFNKGAAFGFPHHNYHITEGVVDSIKRKFTKQPKQGSFRPETTDADVETPAFIKPEVEQRRSEDDAGGNREDALQKAVMKQAESLSLKPIDYGRLQFIKERKPEKLEAYKQKNKLEWLENSKILSNNELLEKYANNDK